MTMTTSVGTTSSTDLAYWAHTTIRYGQQPSTSLPGEPTPAAGLVIVPDSDTIGRSLPGLWSVIHTQTGYHVGPRALPLVYAREAAHLLAVTGVDWTAPRHVLTDPARRLIHVVAEIRAQVQIAWDEGAPVWWGRDSWGHMRPGWYVHFADDGEPHRE